MTLRLHTTAHQAEAEPRFVWTRHFRCDSADLTPGHVFLEREGWNNRMERAFTWLENVRMRRVEAEQLSAILEHEA